MKYVLGLDLGTHSAGWAVVEIDEGGNPVALKDAGVRIFEAPVEPRTKLPKNAARRTARQHRKQLARKKQRRLLLLSILQANGLLPSDPIELEALLLNDETLNPYHLRAQGLDSQLAAHEFGRVLFHLNQRRGFKSNRKTSFGELLKAVPAIASLIEKEEADEAEKELKKSKKFESASGSDDGVVKAGIGLLRKSIESQGARTLGEYLHLVKTGRSPRPGTCQ